VAAARPPAVSRPQSRQRTQPRAASRSQSSGSLTWWVQAGAFEKKNNADEAKKTLDKKGLGSLITSADVHGKTYYRVRVGPYTSQNEASYWRGLIKSVKGCGNAIVIKGK
jgi:DedD protein